MAAAAQRPGAPAAGARGSSHAACGVPRRSLLAPVPAPAPQSQRRPPAPAAASTHGGDSPQPPPPRVPAASPAPAVSQRQQLQRDVPPAVAGPTAGQRLLAGVAGAALTLGALLGGPGDVLAPLPAAQAITTQQLLFLEAWRAVDRAYVDKGFNGQTWFRVREQYLKNEPMSTKEEAYAAIDKMLKSLNDPFTRFLPPDRLAALRRGNSGFLTGVGVEVTYADSASGERSLRVVTPLPAGPAEAAGVRAGDTIVAIEGQPTEKLSLYEASDLLLGTEGSTVKLTVKRRSDGSPQDISLKRQALTVVPVNSSLCDKVAPSVGPQGVDGLLAYVRVGTFNTQTAAAWREALAAARQAGATRIVMDIRNNGGGLFPAGVDIAKSLLKTGDIVLIADSNGTRDIVSTDGLYMDGDTPVTVLVNQGTASASEVLAGALQDNGRATVAGESRTFGKGLIQTVVDLSDGSGVAITVARYQTPLGTDINKVGIAPDLLFEPESLPIGLANGDKKFCDALAADGAPRLFK